MKIIVAVSLLLLSLTAHAQLLKCISKDGRVEYASQCPPGTRQETTNIRNTPTSPASSGAAQQSYAEKEAEFRKRQSEQQEAEALAAKKSAETAQRNRACADARSYLKTLQARIRIVRTNPDTGEQTVLDEASYASEMAAAQASIDANCK